MSLKHSEMGLDRYYSDYDKKIYCDFRKIQTDYNFDNFEIEYSYGDYYTIDFIFVFWKTNKSYKYFFTKKNNNDTWYGVCKLIQYLIVDNLSFKGLKK